MRNTATPPVTRWERIVIGLSPLMIFLAWDNNFNMQVMVPITIILLFGYLAKTRGRFADVASFRLCLLILGSCSASLLSSLLFNLESVTAMSIIRFAYTAVILVWYYVVVNRVYSTRDVTTILLYEVVSGVVISVGVIARYFGGADGKIAVENIWGIPLEENYMASLIAFHLVLAALFVRYSTKLRLRAVFLLCVLSIAVGIVLSGSRAALLGACIALIAMMVSYFIRDNVDKIFFKMMAALILAGLLLCLLASLQDLIPTWYFDRFFRNDYMDSSNSQRIEYWKFGIAGFLERPLFGYGIGNYSYYVDHHASFFASGVVIAHNTYLDALVDVGIVGFLLFTILILRGFKGAWHNGAFIALLIVAFFTSFIVGGERTFFFWNSIAMLSLVAQCCSRFQRNGDVASNIFSFGSQPQASPRSTTTESVIREYGISFDRITRERQG